MIREYQDQETKEKKEVTSLYLTLRAIEILKYGAGQAGLSLSALADSLILQWYERGTPEKDLELTDAEINKLTSE